MRGFLGARTTGLLAIIGAINVALWAFTEFSFGSNALFFASAMLAYGLGLRHAMDADHIAAIDNVTNKLLQEKKPAAAVGLFFSLGHSTVVAGACLFVAIGLAQVQSSFPAVRDFGLTFGTAISGGFLLVLALMNVTIFCATLRNFGVVRRTGVCRTVDLAGKGRGLWGALYRRAFRLVGRDWHMYIVGFLFGLGFDTASEVSLLGISAAQDSRGIPWFMTMMFPILFAAGMSFIDTLDSVFVTKALDWGLTKPLRKLYYNLSVTGLSACIALSIGSLELLGLVHDHWKLSGGFWRAIGYADKSMSIAGYLIVFMFAANWAACLVIYKLKGYDRLEVRVVD